MYSRYKTFCYIIVCCIFALIITDEQVCKQHFNVAGCGLGLIQTPTTPSDYLTSICVQYTDVELPSLARERTQGSNYISLQMQLGKQISCLLLIYGNASYFI